MEDGLAVLPKRGTRAIGELSDAVSDVESSLDAICELLHLANGAKVDSSGMRALLKPLQISLSQVANDLADRL